MRVAIFKLLRVCAISRAYSKVSVKSIDFIELKKTMGRISLYLCIEGTQTFFFFQCLFPFANWLVINCFCFVFQPKSHKSFLHKSDKVLTGLHELTGEKMKNVKKNRNFPFYLHTSKKIQWKMNLTYNHGINFYLNIYFVGICNSMNNSFQGKQLKKFLIYQSIINRQDDSERKIHNGIRM